MTSEPIALPDLVTDFAQGLEGADALRPEAPVHYGSTLTALTWAK
jgi:hypothetical protein